MERDQGRQLREALVGRTLDGRYRIDSVLAMGAMGTVYLARHVKLRKRVALKVLHPDVAGHDELALRFEREALAGGQVSHANVACATDFGELDDGTRYLVMEYVRGESLRTVIDVDAPLEATRAVRIARQIARALRAIHARGIVHRDVKPGNVMIGDDDLVKVVDFGLAKVDDSRLSTLPHEEDEEQRLTVHGVIFGTIAYLAPESARGMDFVDARADLYALGVIFYEMLAGRHPFGAKSQAALFAQQVHDPVPLIGDRAPGVVVEPKLERIVRQLLHKDPASRFRDAGALVAALDEVAPEQRAAAPAPAPHERPPAVADPSPSASAAPDVLPVHDGSGSGADRPVVLAMAEAEQEPSTRRTRGAEEEEPSTKRAQGAEQAESSKGAAPREASPPRGPRNAPAPPRASRESVAAHDDRPAMPPQERRQARPRAAAAARNRPRAPTAASAHAAPAQPAPRERRRSPALVWAALLAVAAVAAYAVVTRDGAADPRSAAGATSAQETAPGLAPATPSEASSMAARPSSMAEGPGALEPPAPASDAPEPSSGSTTPSAASATASASARPLDPERRAARRAPVTEAIGKSRWDEVASAMIALLEDDAAALADPAGRELATNVMTALVRERHPRSDEVSRAIALAEWGPDVLYGFVERSGVAPTSKRAAELLREPEVRARTSPAVAIAFDLREARCDKKADLLARAVAEGDERAIAAMDITVRPCMSRQNRVDEAVNALRERLAAGRSAAGP